MDIKRIGTVMVIVGLCFSSAAAAAENEDAPVANAAAAADVAITPPMSAINGLQAKRPSILPVLYATLGIVQAWDLYSTSAALKAGAHEANPAVALAGQRGSMIGLKVATTASTIFFAERMWKKNRVGAVVLIAAINGTTAAIAMHNMRNARIAAAR